MSIQASGLNNPGNPAFAIYISALSVGRNVAQFKGWVTAFEDSFNAEWTQEVVHSRMDPLLIHKNTHRTLRLAFDVVSESMEEATNNMAMMHLLTQMLYPGYEVPGTGQLAGAATVISAPLLQISWTNLVTSAMTRERFDPKEIERNAAPLGLTREEALGEFMGGGGAVSNITSDRAGLQGACDGYTFEPAVSDGFFIKNGILFPKRFNISLSLKVVHNHLMGQSRPALHGAEDQSGGFADFPYRFKSGTQHQLQHDAETEERASREASCAQAKIDAAKRAKILKGSGACLRSGARTCTNAEARRAGATALPGATAPVDSSGWTNRSF